MRRITYIHQRSDWPRFTWNHEKLGSWLLLVETIPAGSDGTPIGRNLVRNALQSSWGGAGPLSKEELSRLYEARPMGIPEGATPSRLRVVGWVEDGRGRMRAIAQSRCPAPGTDG